MHEDEGTVHPTGWRLPTAIIVVSGVIGYAVTSLAYEALPVLPWSAIPTLVLLALAEGYTAVQTRRRIRREPGTEPILPLSAARLLALAKASAIVGAVVIGLFGGMAAALIELLRIPTPRTEFLTALGTLAGGAALLAAALFLEHACRVPDGGASGGDSPEPPSS